VQSRSKLEEADNPALDLDIVTSQYNESTEVPVVHPFATGRFGPPNYFHEEKGNDEDVQYVTRIRPDMHRAIMDTIAHYGWKDIIYLYSSDEGIQCEVS